MKIGYLIKTDIKRHAHFVENLARDHAESNFLSISRNQKIVLIIYYAKAIVSFEG